MEFSYIRNRIREYDKISIIRNCIDFLRFSERPNKRDIPITDILLILKWTLIYGGQNYPSKIADAKTTSWLIDLVVKLQHEHDFYLGIEKVALEKLISLTSYQQSYFQLPIWKDSFARQILLYTKIKSRYSIEDVFLKETGFEVTDYVILSFFLWVYTNPINSQQNNPFNGVIRDDFYDLAGQFIDKEKVFRFIKILSIDYNTAKETIERDTKIKSFILQTFEISLFAKHPILTINSQNILLHKNLLNYTFNHFPYDFLKEKDNEKFSVEFGKRIEKYVELGLRELNISYKTENQLIKELPRYSKVVDFMVDDDIFIECKAIELKPYPNIYPDDEVLFNWLKDSIVKAYSQQLMTVSNTINPGIVKYGIILTYKETYFGNGIDAWNSFLRSPAEEYANANSLNLCLLPPEHLFFIDISAWDRILMVIKEGKASLKEILLKAISEDNESNTKKFFFYMHLTDYDIGPVNLTYLNDAYKLFDFLNEENIKA